MAISAVEILLLPKDKQQEWVEEQDWFQKEDFEMKLLEAKVTALAVPNLDEDVKSYMTDYQDYGTAGILLGNGYVTEERAEHLEANGDFDEDEQEGLKQCLIAKALDSYVIKEARSLPLNLDGQEILVTFYGGYFPQLGMLDVEFLGIFENKNQIEEAMSNVGVVIENFLEQLLS